MRTDDGVGRIKGERAAVAIPRLEHVLSHLPVPVPQPGACRRLLTQTLSACHMSKLSSDEQSQVEIPPQHLCQVEGYQHMFNPSQNTPAHNSPDGADWHGIQQPVTGWRAAASNNSLLRGGVQSSPSPGDKRDAATKAFALFVLLATTSFTPQPQQPHALLA